MKKSLIIILSLLLALLPAPGCSGGPLLRPENQGANNQDKIKAAVLTAGSFRDDDKIFKQTVMEMGKEEGIEFSWEDAAGDALRQEEQLNGAVRDKVKVIVIEPVDPKMLQGSLGKAQDAGIKIICLNILPPDTQVDAYITPDFTRAGEMQAQKLLTLIPEGSKANILILQCAPADQIAEKILAGNMNILRDNNKAGMMRTAAIAAQDAGAALEAVGSFLAEEAAGENMEIIPAVLAHCPDHTEGILKALDEMPEGRKVLSFGMGTQKAAVEAVKQGKHSGEIDFMPEFLAQLTVNAAADLAEGEVWAYEQQIENGPYTVQARFTPIRLITKENVKVLDERIKALEKAAGSSGQKQEQEQQGQSSGEGGMDSGGENSGGSGGGEKQQKKSSITIKTKDGQEYKMDIPGEIANIEVKTQEDGGEESKEEEGGSGQEGQ